MCVKDRNSIHHNNNIIIHGYEMGAQLSSKAESTQGMRQVQKHALESRPRSQATQPGNEARLYTLLTLYTPIPWSE